MRIYFGAAGAGKAYTKFSNEEPDFFMDNDESKWGKLYLGKKVLPPNFFDNADNVLNLTSIVITSGYVKAILPQLLEFGIPRKKIIIPPKSWLGDHPFVNLVDRIESASFLHKIMIQEKFNVVAVGGTALGLCRENDFILWDFDFDLFACLEERENLYNFLMRLNCRPQYENESIKACFTTSNGVEIPFAVDFFDSSLQQYTDTYEDHVWVWPTHMFLNPKILNIHGYNLRVPNPPEEYLSGVYGEDWRTPNEKFNYFDYGGIS